MYILTMNLSATEVAQYHFSTKVLRAINRRPAVANQILTNAFSVTLHDTNSDEIFETLAIEPDLPRVTRVLSQVALGLYFHHIGTSWSGSLYIIPEFLRASKTPHAPNLNEKMQIISGGADEYFREMTFHGENKEIFMYQVAFPDQEVHAAFRMHFYGGVKVLALFGDSPPAS